MATLKVEKREKTGKYAAFAIRKQGAIPGVLYGTDYKDNLNLSVPLKEFEILLHERARIVDLDIGGKLQKSVIKEVQHGTFDHEIMHADFRAVGENDTLHLSVPVELKGIAAGIDQGGQVEQNLFDVDVECRPADLPTKIELDVTALAVDGILFVSDLPKLPGVKYVTLATLPVVSCRMPSGLEEETAAAEGAAVEGAEGAGAATEPEVIGKKKDEDKEE